MVLDSESKSRDGQNEGGTITLGPRDSLEGKLVCQGDLRVLGTVEGDLEVRGDFLVDNDAVVRAPVTATNVTVRGTLEGDVTARGRLFVGGSGSVTGSARVRRLAVEDGATLNGSLTMDTQATAAAERPSGSDRGADGNSSGTERAAAERRVG
ncbi:MAG: polymer-forming cytoskeletal protein, partial [Candidatus Dormibacteraeota bacterium]|nr:polymer-forming cytoskeletal protein [Candidatus Dormibacteraeota bacterium]